MRRTLLNATSGGLKSPRAIALAPQYGIMFWSDWELNRFLHANFTRLIFQGLFIKCIIIMIIIDYCNHPSIIVIIHRLS